MKSSVWFFVLAGVIGVGLIGFAVWKGSAPSPYDPLAQCLTEKGVKMYGAWWCPHCQSQKELFGSAFGDVDYVECSDANRNMRQECKDAGVEGYPTWILADGTKLSGEQSLETLAEKGQCLDALPSEE